MTTHLLALIAIVLYLAAAGVLARPLLGSGQPLNRLALGLAGVAVLLHAGILLGIHRVRWTCISSPPCPWSPSSSRR